MLQILRKRFQFSCMCRSEYPTVSAKFNEFFENKQNLLFRPLDPDETPVSEVKGAQGNAEGLLAIY